MNEISRVYEDFSFKDHLVLNVKELDLSADVSSDDDVM